MKKKFSYILLFIFAFNYLGADFFSEAQALASEDAVTISAMVVESSPPPSGGGRGRALPPPPQTMVIFEGRAYPNSMITLLKDAQVSTIIPAGANANFTITLSGLSGGNYIFSVYSKDKKGIRSSLLTFPISLTSGTTTRVSGIFIAPTLDVDKSEVKRGDNIAIFGTSVPNSEITISVNSDEEFFLKTDADKDGIFLYNLDTSFLEMEQHFVRSKSAYNGEISSFSKTVSFVIGTKNIAKAAQEFLKGDLNGDDRVNLVDFSIAAFWYKRSISAEFAIKEAERLNGDGKVDLVDFSIMAFFWTG